MKVNFHFPIFSLFSSTSLWQTSDISCPIGMQAFHCPIFSPCFEEACKELNIELYVLPPYSPKQNGRIEAQSPSYASLLAITNLLLGKVRTERSEE